MNIPLKNPCLECDYHLSGGEKNRRECINCDGRIAYVNAIGTHPSTPVNEGVSLEGGAGNDFKQSVGDTLSTLNEFEQTETQKSEKSINNQQPARSCLAEAGGSTIDNPIEDHIKSICKEAGMTLEQIRAGIRGVQNKQKRQKFNEVRDRIIKSLVSGDFGRLSQLKIAKYLGVSNHVISARMKAAGISPMYPCGAQSRIDTSDARCLKRIISKQKKPEKTAPAKPLINKKTPVPRQLILQLDFTVFPEIYDDLKTLAAQELRSPENQALWILKQIQERGMSIINLLKKD